MRVVREGDDHPFDIEVARRSRRVVRVAEQRHVLQVPRALLRLGVDKADEVDPVFRVVQELLREQLPDVARTDDDGVLDIGLAPPRQRPRRGSGNADEHDGGSPEDGELLTRSDARCRSAYVTRITSHVQTVTMWKTPPKSSAVEWLAPLVVAVVEAVELRDDDPRRDREQEGEISICGE